MSAHPDHSLAAGKCFGLTRDAYESHVALAAFGLLTPIANGARYKLGRSFHARQAGQVEPLRFALADKGIDQCAFCTIPETLIRSNRLGGSQLADAWREKVDRAWHRHIHLCRPNPDQHDGA
jgi:hypothetical protein